MKKLMVLIFVLIVIFSIYCSNEKWKGKIYKEQGITIIQNYGMGLLEEKSEKKIKFIEDLKLGVEEGEKYQMFHSNLSIEVDAKYNIYILDEKNHRIIKFNKKGNFIWEVGRKGEGPGEFRNPFDIIMSPFEEICVLDSPSVLHFFNSQGNYLKTVRIRKSFRGVQFLPNGELLVNIFVMGKPGVAAEYYSNEGEFIKKFPDEYRYGQKVPGGASIGGEFRLFNNKIYLSLPNRYEIREYNLEGKLLRKFKRDIKLEQPEIKVSENSFSIRSNDVSGPCFLNQRKMLINRLMIVDQIEKNEFEVKRFLDFFNEKGQFLGSYKLPKTTLLVKIDAEDNYYFVQTDPFPRVIRSKLDITLN